MGEDLSGESDILKGFIYKTITQIQTKALPITASLCSFCIELSAFIQVWRTYHCWVFLFAAVHFPPQPTTCPNTRE